MVLSVLISLRIVLIFVSVVLLCSKYWKIDKFEATQWLNLQSEWLNVKWNVSYIELVECLEIESKQLFLVRHLIIVVTESSVLVKKKGTWLLEWV